MLMEQFKPFVISPCHSGLEAHYFLENGIVSIEADVIDKIHFHCDSPCLALVDYEILDNKILITEVHLIATNVDRIKLISWLKDLQSNLIGYLVILIGLITKVKDNCLRAEVIAIIFHEKLHPKQIFSDEFSNVQGLYPSMIISGQKTFLKCQSFSCSQKLRDTLLVKCLLKELARNELISDSIEYRTIKELIVEKLDKLLV